VLGFWVSIKSLLRFTAGAVARETPASTDDLLLKFNGVIKDEYLRAPSDMAHVACTLKNIS